MPHAIGAHTFVTMSRYPGLVEMTKATEAQAGQHGVGVWFKGIRGKSFQVDTVGFFADMATGQTNARAYRLLTQLAPVQVYFDGVLVPDHVFDVLDVDSIEVKRVAGCLNGVAVGSKVTARWTLQPIGT